MITDPLEEWRSLKEHYGRLSDEALNSLLEESGQLTDIAKETLRAEISKPRPPRSAEGHAPACRGRL
jgi:hypothetical protein